MANETLADVDGGPLQLRPSIFCHTEEGLKRNPNGISTIVMHQDADYLSELANEENIKPSTARNSDVASKTCLQWTYTQLHRAGLSFAKGLVAHGIRPGMRMSMLIPNRVEVPLTIWTCSLLRLAFCPLDGGAVTQPRREELTKLMDSVKPDVVMVNDESGAQAVDQVFSRMPEEHSPKVKIILKGTTSGWKTLLQLSSDGSKSSIDEEKLVNDARTDDHSRTSLLLFTSGTSTGNPKGCPRHVGATLHSHEAQFWGRGITTSTKSLASSANFRIISPSLHYASWKAGGTAIMPDPSAGTKGTIAAIREYKINFILFIPALLKALISDPNFESLDVSCVKDIALGGDMITRDIFYTACKAFPDASVCTSHGMTEGGGVFKWPYFGKSIDEIPWFRETSPMGYVTRGARLRIIDPDDTSKIMKRNEPGEFAIHCESIVKHYLNHTNEDAFFVDEEGRQWFRTGDLAMINDDGIIYILGRIKDVIKRSGISITPAAMESCIEKFVGKQTSVIAWPHEVLGEVPLAILDDWNGKTEKEVQEEVVRMFGKDYALGPVVTLEELGLAGFPLNATGKIMKNDLLKEVKRYFDEKGRH